jgi:osmoprotectant transport system ATP-binding protein
LAQLTSADPRKTLRGVMLELRHVGKRFGPLQALSGVSFRLERGRTGVLIGLSGSGKSTVLRLILGLIEPDEGEVLVSDQPVAAAAVRAQRLRIGYVAQEGGLFAHLCARDNVALMARHLHRPEAQIGARIDALRELVRLPEKALARYPIELSGGERQRVSLMRALALDPDVLLLDEPLAALDPITRAELQQDLREIFRSLSKTVLLVTHDLREAAYLGQFVALMRDGRIVQQGSFADLVERPADDFVRRFVAAQDTPLAGAGAGAPP